jgi:hypothetical protein
MIDAIGGVITINDTVTIAIRSDCTEQRAGADGGGGCDGLIFLIGASAKGQNPCRYQCHLPDIHINSPLSAPVE